MEEKAAALHTVESAVQALGRGFDVTFDSRLLYCKGLAESRIVEVDEEHTRDFVAFDDLVVANVSRDIRRVQVKSRREASGIRSFHEMAEYFNIKACLSGSVPLGNFNSAFNFTGLRHIDSAATKSLAVDGFYVPLVKVELMKLPLVLRENVRHAVPCSWDPMALASFIENFGTHVITSVTIGGRDVIYVKQHNTSSLSAAAIKHYVQDIGDQRFSDTDAQTSRTPVKFKDKAGDSFAFNSQGVHPQPSIPPFLTGKEDVTVILRRRGGDDLIQSHTHWAKTVRFAPDVVDMTFCPISSLLDGIPGKDHLVRAIDLYLENKPPIEELRYFLEFQIPRVWAPNRDHLPGPQRKGPVCPSLQFSLMGPKLYVSPEQVSVGRKPVTGLRLCLEGSKQKRLCVHLQHLATLPKILQPYWDIHVAIGPPRWHGAEEQDTRWFEPVKWKNFSNVSTAPIELNESYTAEPSGAYIVTGAQLGVWDFGNRNVLHLKLLYSKVPGCTIKRSVWDHTPSQNDIARTQAVEASKTSDSSSGMTTAQAAKLMKIVDMSEMSKGPQDPPGHWLVTGAKLGVEKGKIVLRVKYSLLNF
ncbi:MACPF domain-containing protein CAD1-like [Nymphaea colorata]|nr:MACPF domain-containing protein CAD1-like [Nymphaea colorata]XP_031496335.1 MACPF domain-containing protein CAD1-like [Nymphaea colorata]